MCGTTRLDKCGNEEMRRKVCVRKKNGDQVDLNDVKWFCQVVRLSGDQLSEGVLKSKLGGRRDTIRHCTG